MELIGYNIFFLLFLYQHFFSGFETYVVKDATRGISESGVELAIQQMIENDIKIINSHELKNFIHKSNSIAFDVNGQVQKSFNYVLINLLVIVTTYYL